MKPISSVLAPSSDGLQDATKSHWLHEMVVMFLLFFPCRAVSQSCSEESSTCSKMHVFLVKQGHLCCSVQVLPGGQTSRTSHKTYTKRAFPQLTSSCLHRGRKAQGTRPRARGCRSASQLVDFTVVFGPRRGSDVNQWI